MFVEHKDVFGLTVRASVNNIFGARNLFDKAPPLTSSNYGFNGAISEPTGRFVYFELSKDF